MLLPHCHQSSSNNSISFAPIFHIFGIHLLLLLLLLSSPLHAHRHCYSCSGQCMAGAPCNCQMGSCEADFCFSEKKPSEIPGIFRLTKGCVKRPSRTRGGCDFDHFADHILCVCSGPGDFCNDHILMRVNTAAWRNVTCRACPDGRPDCGQTCQGQWCHQKTSTGASGCGFGPPSLPYFYQTHELLRQTPKVCLTMSRGTAGSSSHRFCVCNGNFCNEPDSPIGGRETSKSTLFGSIFRSISGTQQQQQQQQQRSIGRQWEMAALARVQQQPLYECVSCDLSSEDSALTSNCRQNRCTGQFCVYAAQRLFTSPGGTANAGGGGGGQVARGQQQQQMINIGGGAVMHEKQGCINVTEPAFVQLGCAHKWVQNELEEIYCACRGNLCNADLSTASASSAQWPHQQLMTMMSWRRMLILMLSPLFSVLPLPVVLQFLLQFNIFICSNASSIHQLPLFVR